MFTPAQDSHMTVAEAAQALGISKNRVLQLIDEGKLPSSGGAVVPGRHRKHRLGPADVVALRDQRADKATPSDLMTTTEAAEALGVSKGRVFQLVDEGKLTTTGGAVAQGKHRKHHLARAEVEALRDQRLATIKPKTPEEREARRLDLIAERERVSALREALAEGLLTPTDVARDLGISRQAVSQLVNRGRLLTVTVGGHRLVRRSDLDAFKKLRASRLAGIALEHAGRVR
ncbi:MULTISPECIES: helix-turn-helix domain-containing protein [Burkholderiaceae]|uniref:helix-turn-helix domain-containing protein n=1 Tax=Burkholderiaceae TaxID=119060 RepID=UPI0002A44A8F|nr:MULTISPECIES: helix-turn-helix domain-containing protein [Burkholderiaceae]ELA00772.1 hypothetical protein D769_03140 [Cupriavidus sp. HMR-1]KVS16408.1 hypothetical protein WK32_26970 [Burkholderia vietnamiensis]MDR8057719.1 excisionase family DNA-binding protein [Burkholderia cenocepacia]MDR8062189.1 excisionase family DNA-binding protein [Burkholderia cenocepacia]